MLLSRRALCLCLLCLPLLFAGPARAADSSKETVDALLSLLDGTSKRQRMKSMEALNKAGFTYEQHLVVPEKLNLSCKSPDERDVLAGMRTVDWEYALFFGQQAEQGECILPFTLGKKHIIAPLLSDRDWKKIKANPCSEEARDILVRRTMDFQRKLLEEGRKNPDALMALGARHYGATLESLYIFTILVLAAEESDSLEYLKKLQAGSFSRQNKVLEVLLRNKHLGDAEHFRHRADLVRSVLDLLEKNNGRPSLKDLAAVLEIIQPERDRYLAPCGG